MDYSYSLWQTQVIAALEQAIQTSKADVIRLDVGRLPDSLVSDAGYYESNAITILNSSYRREKPFANPFPVLYDPQLGPRARVVFDDGLSTEITLFNPGP